MYILNWLWWVEICKLDFVWRYLYIPEVKEFEFHQPVFNQIAYVGLNSLQKKRYHISVKIWFFWWSILQKRTGIGHFDAIDDQRIRKFFEEVGLLRPVRLQRLLKSMKLQRFLRPGKSQLMTSESSWILQSLIWGQK